MVALAFTLAGCMILEIHSFSVSLLSHLHKRTIVYYFSDTENQLNTVPRIYQMLKKITVKS
jgi:hypothetical protein